VYRTQLPASARDWRKMELIKTNTSDTFTVSVGENIPGQFVFIDATAIPRQPYYYGVIAVGLSDEGKWLKSRMSNVVAGQAYDLTPPEPPVWIFAEWITDATGPAVRLVWHCAEDNLFCTAQRRPLGGGVWSAVSSKTTAEFDFEFLDRTATPGDAYDYRILCEDSAGNKTLIFNIRSVWPSAI